MLVTFKSTAYADITMFGDAATQLLKLMGQSGNVPGAIVGKDVSAARDALKEQLAHHPESDTDADSNHNGNEYEDEEQSNRVTLATRAMPLLELLDAASDAGANVMWDN